ncbi:hypothetical protein EDB92DRAFT_1890687 [Lactarius akahatsu]|uniref:Uncharacterized protein n=1 Tax=Lactarius akahatsu TaxID=416441 RepID=A0AAD4L7L2_9AGAM|nr:hypothetical protein EDB92DRAFT_1890687 [Lactarius akahatsu]
MLFPIWSPRHARTLNPKRPSILRTKNSSKKESTGKPSPIPRVSTLRNQGGQLWFGQKPSKDGTQLAESKGSRSQPVRVEVAGVYLNPKLVQALINHVGVLRHDTLWGDNEGDKEVTKKRTKSVRIDAFFLQPSSQRILRLYAKRSRKSDILSGTRETVIPAESQSDISVALGQGNGQAGHSSWVTSGILARWQADRLRLF